MLLGYFNETVLPSASYEAVYVAGFDPEHEAPITTVSAVTTGRFSLPM